MSDRLDLPNPLIPLGTPRRQARNIIFLDTFLLIAKLRRTDDAASNHKQKVAATRLTVYTPQSTQYNTQRYSTGMQEHTAQHNPSTTLPAPL